MSDIEYNPIIAKRFRGFLPIVIDVETGGLDPIKNPVLELAAVTVNCDEKQQFYVADSKQMHIEPFAGSKISQESLEINKIIPDHPFRFAINEEKAVKELFKFVQPIIKQTECTRCVLVGHNAWFDLAFLNAMLKRAKTKKSLFHAFTSIDTATLGVLLYGHTVLAELLKKTKISFDQSQHHSAIYDAQKTAELFCHALNQLPWP